jgi:DNA-directed RNA polymerase II subunit RPB1
LINAIKKSTNKQKSLDQSDEIYKLKTFQDHLLNKMVLRGIKNIDRVIPRKIMNTVKEEEGQFVKKDIWVLDTVGTNLLEILNLDYIDVNRTYTNDIREIKRVLGIEAARQAIFNEITDVMEHDDTYINYHHVALLCDRMACNDKMVSIFRHGINNDNIGPIAKASFEETPEMFLKAARHAELDTMRGVSANVMCGQEGYFGTSAFQTMLDINKFTKLKAEQINLQSNTEIIENSFMNIENKDDPCSMNNLTFENNVENLNATNTGDVNEYEPDF